MLFGPRPVVRRWSTNHRFAATKKLRSGISTRSFPRFVPPPPTARPSGHILFTMSCIIIGRTRAPLWPTCARYCGERETHREKFMRGRNEQPNRTKWTYLASPRINKQQQMTAYVRPFLRHRFHRSGSRSVKDSSLLAFPHSLPISVSLSRGTTSTGEATLLFRHPSAFLLVLTRSWTARGVPPGGCWILRGSFAPRSLPISEFVLLETFREMIFSFPFFSLLRFFSFFLFLI